MASSLDSTHYEILGISQQAQLKEVRDAYLKLALKYHPDKDRDNPLAGATFQRLGAAYEILSDENRRTKYDAILSSTQRARQPPQSANCSPQRPSEANATTRAWQEDMRRRAWDWSRKAQERADQARREDADFWSGPTYAHGATDRSGWDKQWDREQKDRYDLYEYQQRQRAARREARKEAELKKRDMNTPPPRDPFDQGEGNSEARAEMNKKKQEAREKAQRERREDDGYWGTPPSPQRPYPDWSDKVEEESHVRLKHEKKERADGRKAEREQLEKKWPAELQLLLSKIISIEVEIDETQAKVDESKRVKKDKREEEDHEQIFDLPIKRKSLERRLKECLGEYKRIVEKLRGWGRAQEADEADVKLREARREVARDERVGGRESSRGEQAESTIKTKRKAKAEKKPSVNNEGSCPKQKCSTRQPSERSESRGAKCNNAGQTPKTRLPMPERRNNEDPTQQHQSSREYVYDVSDPDRGFTKGTPEPSIAGDDNDYDDEDYDPPFCNDFHDSHMEVHREFWDIIDSWHECNFCHNVCTVMRCPECDVQACAYCKDSNG